MDLEVESWGLQGAPVCMRDPCAPRRGVAEAVRERGGSRVWRPAGSQAAATFFPLSPFFYEC